MKIAIVGSGIAGLTCAYLLNRQHDIQVFEASDWIGGHTHTVDVQVDGRSYAIDTGFIVFNDWASTPTSFACWSRSASASSPPK